MKFSSTCSICKRKIKDGVGRFNLPTGVECVECHDKPRLEPKYVKIAGYNIPYKKLKEYAETVEYTRRQAIVGQASDDPLIVMRALEIRVKIHKEIFKITGHDHDSTEPEPMRIRRELEAWLEKNVTIKPQVNGLV